MKNSATILNKKCWKLCIGCGSCGVLCPINGISLKYKGSCYKAVADTRKCINCGICLKVCPAYKVNLADLSFDRKLAKNLSVGNVRAARVAWVGDFELRKRCSSGGIVTQILLEAIDKKIIDVATVVDMSNPDREQAKMMLTSSKDDILRSIGSKYVYVNIANLIKELLLKKKRRIAIVGLPCQFHAIFKLLLAKGIATDSLYFIGLMCSKSQSYRIFQYYKELYAKAELETVDFRYKDLRGAPGDVRIVDHEGNVSYAPLEERRNLSKFYRNRRCYFCFDKNNVLADLTVGDCFIERLRTAKGENSVLIRTEKGMELFEIIKKYVSYKELCMNEFMAYGQEKCSEYKHGMMVGLYPNNKYEVISFKDKLRIWSIGAREAFWNKVPTKFIKKLVWKNTNMLVISSMRKD